MGPSATGFLAFVRGVMGLSPTTVPDASPSLAIAYAFALSFANPFAQFVDPQTYAYLVYNLAADRLVRFALDLGDGVLTQLRQTLRLDSPAPLGIVQGASDNGTSGSLMVPDALRNLTLSDLSYLQTPWGRLYLELAQQLGTIWGLT